jgi:glutathione-regulated potassium-efflux system ancillary protein KefG
VLEHGWAYGDVGRALWGKVMAQAISAGGLDAAYQRGGSNHFTVRELLAPFEQTARLCGMDYAEAFTVHATFQLDATALADVSARYQTWLGSLRDGSAPLWLPPS